MIIITKNRALILHLELDIFIQFTTVHFVEVKIMKIFSLQNSPLFKIENFLQNLQPIG